MAESIKARAIADLRVVLRNGDEVATPIVPESVTWTRAPHSRADTCDLTIGTTAVPFQLTDIASMLVILFAGRAGENKPDILRDDTFRTRANLRFIGDVDEPEIAFSDRSPTVALKCRDLSARFRDWPLVAEAVGRYTDTLGQAIGRIMATVPGHEGVTLRANDPGLLDMPLAKLAGKVKARGPLPFKSGITAWDAIESVCGMAALLATVALDELLILRPGEVFGDPGKVDQERIAYSFVWGTEQANLSDLTFRKKFVRNRRGIMVVGYDPDTDAKIEAVWPPDSDLPAKYRPLPAHPPRHADGMGRRTLKDNRPPPKHPRTTPPRTTAPERDVLYLPGVHTTDGLLDYAKRIWAERGSQEMEGRLISPMWDDGILALRNGDRVNVKVRPDIEAQLHNLAGDRARAIEYIKQTLLVSDGAARALVNLTRAERFDRYLVNTASHSLAADGVPRSTVEFHNLIRV